MDKHELSSEDTEIKECLNLRYAFPRNQYALIQQLLKNLNSQEIISIKATLHIIRPTRNKLHNKIRKL